MSISSLLGRVFGLQMCDCGEVASTFYISPITLRITSCCADCYSLLQYDDEGHFYKNDFTFSGGDDDAGDFLALDDVDEDDMDEYDGVDEI